MLLCADAYIERKHVVATVSWVLINSMGAMYVKCSHELLAIVHCTPQQYITIPIAPLSPCLRSVLTAFLLLRHRKTVLTNKQVITQQLCDWSTTYHTDWISKSAVTSPKRVQYLRMIEIREWCMSD